MIHFTPEGKVDRSGWIECPEDGAGPALTANLFSNRTDFADLVDELAAALRAQEQWLHANYSNEDISMPLTRAVLTKLRPKK